ncbi:MAG: hypothetical protein AB7G88_11685 [Thermomicrobiales bacterium]
MNRPIGTLVLAAASALAFISNLIVTLQFLEVLPWGDEDFEFWGGKWAGVVVFGVVTALSLLVCYGWLTVKPWAFTFTIIMALVGLSIPVSALMAGTETLSTALIPIVVNAGILLLTLSKSVRQSTKPGAAAARGKSKSRQPQRQRDPRIIRPDDI